MLLLCQAQYVLATTDKSGVLQNSISGESVPTVGAGQYLQMLLALVFVISLIFMVAWFIRRMGNVPGATKGSLKVLAGVSLGQRERVVLMQAGKKHRIQIDVHKIIEVLMVLAGKRIGGPVTAGERVHKGIQ